MDDNFSKKTDITTFVTPGSKLGVIEEYIPSRGTYQKNGMIYASIPGMVVIDKSTREIKVFPITQKILIPHKGDVVIARVDDAKDRIVFLDIFVVKNKKFKPPLSGMIFINQIDKKYVEKAKDAFRAGDVVRARVIRTTSPIQLSTIGRNLGVLLAYCTQCGALLRRIRENKLKCDKCGNLEKRKLAVDYEKFYEVSLKNNKI